MAVTLTILGSGSGGNCALFETPQLRLLIDAGYSGKQIDARLKQSGRSLKDVDAVLITHDHSDHTQGLPALANRFQIPVYANRLTAEAIQKKLPELKRWKIFQTGQSFSIGEVTVENFSIPHDTHDPVGFLLRHGDISVGFLTDLGHATRLIIDRIKSVNVLVLETNHDPKMLQDDPGRPWRVKQRILSGTGHLSNEAAAGLAVQVVHAGLSHIYLAHLSRDCNRPELALRAVSTALKGAGAHHVKIHLTSQTDPCPPLVLGEYSTSPTNPVLDTKQPDVLMSRIRAFAE